MAVSLFGCKLPFIAPQGLASKVMQPWVVAVAVQVDGDTNVFLLSDVFLLYCHFYKMFVQMT